MQTIQPILILQDDAKELAILKKLFSGLDLPAMNVLEIKSLHRLLELKDNILPAVILLDLHLPDGSGLEIFLTVRNLFPLVPVIVLSEPDDTETAMQCLQAGAQDFLVKGDFDGKLLQKTIQYSIERKRGQVSLEESINRYKWVFNATSDPLRDWNILTGEIYWNDKVSIFGFPEAEKKNYSWWLANIHPDDVKEVLNNLNKNLEGSASQWSATYRFRCIHGEYKHILDRGYILRNNNTAYRMIGTMQDISDLKKKEEQLVNNQYHLRTILETEPECIKLLDREGHLLDMNPAGLSMIEADSLEQVKGQKIIELVDEPYHRAFEELNQKVFAGKSGKLQFEITGFRGSKIWLETHAVPFRDAGGVITGLLGITRNITETKKAVDKLRRSEEKYRSLVEEASDAIFINDLPGNILDVNNRACQMLGYSRNQLCRMNITDLFSEEELKRRPIMKKELLAGERTFIERNILHSSGKEIPVEITAIMTGEGNTMAILRDITERRATEARLKASEKNLRQTLSSMADIFYVIDKNYQIILLNKVAEKQLTKAWGKPVKLGDNILGLIPQNSDELIEKNFERVFRGEKFEYELAHTNPELPEWMMVSYRPVMDDGGEVVGACVITRDISEQKKAERELKESYEQIRRLSDHLQVVREEEQYAIAREIHDVLGQQLTVIKMEIAFLEGYITGEGTLAKTKLKNLLDLVDESINTVRKLSADLRPGILDDLGLVAALESHCDEFELHSGIKSRFISDIPEVKLPAQKATSIFRIFQESLTNIARHSAASEITVSLSQRNNQLRLNIKDNGKGFVTDDVKNKKTLGLLGMRERVAMMGGTCQIQSASGKGTIINVSIPLPNPD